MLMLCGRTVLLLSLLAVVSSTAQCMSSTDSQETLMMDEGFLLPDLEFDDWRVEISEKWDVRETSF